MSIEGERAMQTQQMLKVYQLLQSGAVTIRELKGITDAEMESGLAASRRLLRAGQTDAAAEVLSGLALYDPYCPGVWKAMEELCRSERLPRIANLCADLARAVV